MNQDDPPDEYPPHYIGPPTTEPPQVPVQPYAQQPFPPMPAEPTHWTPQPYGDQRPAWRPAPRDPRRANRVWGAVAQVLLALTIPINILFIDAVWRQRQLLHRVLNGDTSVSLIDVDHADDYATKVSIAYVIAALLTGIVFIVWFWRLRRDAEYLNPGLHRWSTGWAIGGWLVPVMNLWVPYRTMNDIYRSFQAPPGTYHWDRRPSRVTTVWWLLYIATLIGNRVVVVMNHGNTVAAFDNYTTAALVVSVLGIAAASAAIAVVEIMRRSNTQAWQRIYATPPA